MTAILSRPDPQIKAVPESTEPSAFPTVVSLQLASNQFSPRVMRSFIRDRMSQAVIGLLVGNFFFCVLILPTISGEPTDPAPRVSLTIAVVLTLVTVIGIILHLDHLARGLQVGELVRVITGEGEEVAEQVSQVRKGLTPADPKDFEAPDSAAVIVAKSSGWVSQVDSEELLHLLPADTAVRLETRIGAYIHAGEPLLRVWPPTPESSHGRLEQSVRIADARTMLQDVDFAVRQLVDIGLRALSPPINDPTTTVEVILRLGTLLRTVLVAPLAPLALQDASGRVLLTPWALDHDEYVEHAFDQLRQACTEQPEVAATILRVLRMLKTYVHEEGYPQRAEALDRQARMLLESLGDQPGLHSADLRRLRDISADETDPADHSRRTD